MKVFISYYRKTGWFAASIFEQWLNDAGIDVVMDQRHFRAGKLLEEVERQIKGSDVLLVVLSHQYYTSDWTKQEIMLANQYEKHVYYVATAKDLRAKTPPTFKSDSNDLPLELWGKEVGEWRDILLDLLKELIKTGQIKEHDVRFNVWFSKHVKCNDWVREAVTRENITNTLHVSSCVELAHSMDGWTKDNDIFSHYGGTFPVEPAVLEYLNLQEGHDEYPPIEENRKPDNCALVSLSEWLSDTKCLELYFRAISHNLVRQVADNFEALYYQQDSLNRPRLFDPGHLNFPHSVIVHMVLVTRDNYLIIGQRTSNVRFYENHWATTYEEHMKISHDSYDPFDTAIRGLKEELVGENKSSITEEVRFFSVFRELDQWENASKGQAFWVANIGLVGKVRLRLSADKVLAHWLYRKEKGSGHKMQDPEFQHLVAIPYSFENLLRLVTEDTFNPATFSGLRVPTGVNKEFPEIASDPRLQRQHPTNKLRLIRCLTSDDFRIALQQKIRTEPGLQDQV